MSETSPFAVFQMNAFGGIEIFQITYGVDDYVIWGYNFGRRDNRKHESVIEYDYDGRAYFLADSVKIYIDECQRLF